jgi:tight adherence protein B
MAFLVLLAFVAGFLLVFGINLLYSEIQRERKKKDEELLQYKRRMVQSERARVAVQNRDLYELAAKGAADLKTSQPLAERVALYFEQAGVPMRFGLLILLGVVSAAGGVTALWLLTRSWLIAGVIGATGLLVPLWYVRRLHDLRMDKLVSQLPDAFDQISRAMRAGQTFSHAFQSTAQEGAPPLSDELAYCCDQQRLGMSFEAALRDIGRRTGVLEVRIFVMAALIHRQTGGNLADLLERLADIIRERYRMHGLMQALTAEGRTQARVLLGLPVAMLILMTVLNRDYVAELYQHPWLLIATAAAMIIGHIWLRRLTTLDF